MVSLQLLCVRQDELGLTSVSAANNTPLTTEVLRPDSVTQKERNTDGRTECDPPSQNSHPIKRKKELLLQAQSQKEVLGVTFELKVKLSFN